MASSMASLDDPSGARASRWRDPAVVAGAETGVAPDCRPDARAGDNRDIDTNMDTNMDTYVDTEMDTEMAGDNGSALWLDADAGPVVRPYAMTGGRTAPTTGDFNLISLVTATRPVSSADVGLAPEHVTIVELSRRPISVAEISAHLDLPVGIVRVLLGDLLDRALIMTNNPEPVANLTGDGLFEAVINGLQAL
jgi:hypothetical protein